jgi:virulence factor
MTDVRIALIGVGSMTQRVHLPSLAAIEGTVMAAACDLDETRLTTVADQYGIKGRYTDYRTMIRETTPDGVYAVGQPHLMYDVWVWCLQQGIPLFIEKPMGLSWHQAQMLARLAETHGVITQVGFQRRTCPLLVTLRDKLSQQGPITHVVCEFYKRALESAWSPRDRMLDDCVHAIDTVRWACGGRVVDIQSHCKRVGVADINWISALLCFDNGSSGVVISSWSSGRRIFRVEMHAEGTCAEADPEGSGHLYGAEREESFDTRAVAGSDEFHVYGGFLEKSREFVESLRSGVEHTSSPFRDAVETMRVAEKILAQALLRDE